MPILEMKGLKAMTLNTSFDIPTYVSECLQLAILLEVSAYPKPGNVHRTADFQETGYEHFLASAVALEPHFRHAAAQGVAAFSKKISMTHISVGKTIRDAVNDVMTWQHGGNTLLGSIILLVPMASAAGLTLWERHQFEVDKFRQNVKSVVESTTAEDAVNVYDAINTAQPGGLGSAPQLDVTSAGSKEKIVEEDISLLEVFRISSPWDSISSEWVNNYHITFDMGYPFFIQQLKNINNINAATVHTYLKILSEIPDTLIARKAGRDKARWVSMQAKRILEEGGLTTEGGRRSLFRLDRKLHDSAHKLNPGTTADITSTVLAVAVLSGYRP